MKKASRLRSRAAALREDAKDSRKDKNAFFIEKDESVEKKDENAANVEKMERRDSLFRALRMRADRFRRRGRSLRFESFGVERRD